MALLARAVLTEYRNHARLVFAPSRGLSVVTGPNGSGKTSLLEALSLLGPGRGLRGARPEQLARHGGPGIWAVAATIIDDEGLHRELGTGLPPPAEDATAAGIRRVFRLDGAPATAAAGFALLPSVWLTPQMERLFGEAPSGRRRFLDRLVAAIEPAHAGTLAAHDTAVANRNRLLADGRDDARWLAATEDTIARRAVAATAARLAFCERVDEFGPGALAPFPAASLRLLDPVADRLAAEPARLTEDWLRAMLARERTADARQGATRLGAHRTDLAISDRASGRPASLGSTGEQKALLVGIVLAHAALLASDRGTRPLLLLDEPLVHLDGVLRAALLDRLAAADGQTLLTGVDPAPFRPVAATAAFFEVSAGTARSCALA